MYKYRLDADPRELRDLVSRGPWAVGVPSAARALLPGPRGSLNRVVPKATHLTILDYSAGASNARCIDDGWLTGVRLWRGRTGSRQAICSGQQPFRRGVQQRLYLPGTSKAVVLGGAAL